MNQFASIVSNLGTVEFPKFSGIRIMMMPFRIADLDTVPAAYDAYKPLLRRLKELACMTNLERGGVSYLTVDEAIVQPGETHRRPGLHVDGVGEDGGWSGGAYGGGGGGGYAASGMVVAANAWATNAFNMTFTGIPGPDGDCEHLRDQIEARRIAPEDCYEHYERELIPLLANRAYYLNGLGVHETFTVVDVTYRQFIRLSLPSNAPWHEGYTENPLGIKPTGPILPARTKQMGFRR